MLRILCMILVVALLSACSAVEHTVKYGYLPEGEYAYYEPLSPVDLQGRLFDVVVVDRRKGDSMPCYDQLVPRDTELEGIAGTVYFKNYLMAMIEQNNGKLGPGGERLEVRLKVISGDTRAVSYGRIFGLVEFEATVGDSVKNYCTVMVDGDADSPIARFSFDPTTVAFRAIVSGAARRALESYMRDLAATALPVKESG